MLERVEKSYLEPVGFFGIGQHKIPYKYVLYGGKNHTCYIVVNANSKESQWPNGGFGLLKAKTGCPGDFKSGWREGWRFQDMEDYGEHSRASLKNHMDIFSDDYGDINRTFCMLNEINKKTIPWPIGSYCIYKSNISCPKGMSTGSVKWDDENDRNLNEEAGELPYGTYDDDTVIHYCCQTDGKWYEPIELPVTQSFYLLTSNSLTSPKCQMVKWATSEMEYITFNTEDDNNADRFSGKHAFVNTLNAFRHRKLHYCYYEDCRCSFTGPRGSISLLQTAKYESDLRFRCCAWLITVKETFIISLSFSKLTIPLCNQSLLTIYNGPNDTSPVLGKYCGENASAGLVIRSSKNQLFLVSNSDSFGSHSKSLFAFLAHYYATHLEDCRCIFTGPSGSIVTHNATRYQRNSRSQCCSWLITAKETLQILLSFSRLTVPQCNFASLTIYNGRNDTSFVLGNYCGENATAGIKVLSSKNHLFLVTNFWSYGSHPKKVFTFRAKYYVTQLEDNQWPNGNFGLLKAKTGCPSDWKSGWREGWRFQDMKDGSMNSKASLKNHMAVSFHMRKLGVDINRTFCMMNQIDEKKRLWPNGSYCIYKSNANCPKGMSTGFVEWDDEDDENSNKKGGQLPHGTYNDDTVIHYCCQTDGKWYEPIELPVTQPFYLLTSNSLSLPKCQIVKWATSQMEYILFDTDDNNIYGGFAGKHVFVNSSARPGLRKLYYCYYKDCRCLLFGPSGSISSHKSIEDKKSSSFQCCSWLITVEEPFLITLKFLKLTMTQCNSTFLTIYDGQNDTYPLLGKYCEGNKTAEMKIRSSKNHLFLMVKSLSNGLRPKSLFTFYAKYFATPLEENEWPNGNFGLLKAESGCPGDRKSGWLEGWRFQNMEEYGTKSRSSLCSHIAVSFPYRYSGVDVNRTFCMLNQINEKNRLWPNGSYCIYKSSDNCPKGMSSGNVKWDDENYRNKNKKGGILPYGTYDDDTRIYYCCQTDGKWYEPIELPVTKPFYLLTSNSLTSPKCQMVKYAESEMEYILFETEFYNNSDSFSGKHVFVNTSTGSNLTTMYYCYYEDCRCLRNESSGSIKMPDTIECESVLRYRCCAWLITVKKTFIISLTFSKLTIPLCNQSILTIYNGPNDTSPVLGKYCGENASAGLIIRSSKNQLFLVSNSGSFGPHSKSLFSFLAHYYATHLEDCNCSLTGLTGSIYLRMHKSIEDEKSSSFQCCSWLITVEEPFIIKLKFLGVTLPQCNNTFLTIYDGQDDTSPAIGKYCKENATAGMEIRSSRNHLFVSYNGYGSQLKRLLGFHANYYATNSQDNPWPGGDFGLLKAKTGCPGDWKSGWREGWRLQHMESDRENSSVSIKNHMAISFSDVKIN
ncbi:cubilin-like isoform X3 [Xenia sp. Carnegie-2017]|nr:cubilin-like isoform X3 [Xenia sp. Carnegie-2017]